MVVTFVGEMIFSIAAIAVREVAEVVEEIVVGVTVGVTVGVLGGIVVGSAVTVVVARSIQFVLPA